MYYGAFLVHNSSTDMINVNTKLDRTKKRQTSFTLEQ